MKVVFVSSEVVPFSKTGGLADVAGSLPAALARAGMDVLVITPLYGTIDPVAHGLTKIARHGEVPGLGGKHIWEARQAGVRILFVGSRGFERREFYHENGVAYPDNDERFSFFCRIIPVLLKWLNFKPDIAHVHDWQAALLPVYLRTTHGRDDFFKSTATVLTIHNLAYQGVFKRTRFPALMLPERLFSINHLEFYGQTNFLKGGIMFSDALSTVSPTYAREIQTPQMGYGLDGVLRDRRDTLSGILNGVDYASWDPSSPRGLIAPFSADRPEGKSAAKAALQDIAGLPRRPAPLFSVVSRMDPQKGLDILASALRYFLPKRDMQVVVLGRGLSGLEREFTALAGQFPQKLAVRLGFDDAMARRVYAGSDFFVMPSRYEPCGLGQMIAMAYGTAPIVRRTGGLADTVQPFYDGANQGTGLVFELPTPQALGGSIAEALTLYRNSERMGRLRSNVFRQKFTWAGAAAQYIELYLRARRLRLKEGGIDVAKKKAESQSQVAEAELPSAQESLLHEAGVSAGKVWHFLDSRRAAASLTEISKETGLDNTMTQIAVGWLARENNIKLEKDGRKVQVELNRR